MFEWRRLSQVLKDELDQLKRRPNEPRKEIKADIMCARSSMNNLHHTQARTKPIKDHKPYNLEFCPWQAR